jgi:TonB family protein
MSHELFHDVTDRRPRASRAAGGTLVLSIVAHALVLAAVIVVPLFATDALPLPSSGPIKDWLPVVPPTPVPAVVASRRTRATKADTSQKSVPLEPPPQIVDELPPNVPAVCDTCVVDPTGSLLAVGTDGGTGLTLPEPPPPPKPDPPKILRLSSVQMPTKVRDVAPVYPLIAQTAGIEGTVIIEAVIGADGLVRDARVLRSQMLLDQAALDAVRAWRYEPTRVGGVAVPVIVTVTVQFRLQR